MVIAKEHFGFDRKQSPLSVNSATEAVAKLRFAKGEMANVERL
jgi:hypothetical protein